MAEVIRMPKLSDTMTEGVVAVWHKKVGDAVKNGELLAEIETDKATMEFESFYDGVLLHIGVQKGQTAPVDALLCIVGKQGEDISALLKDTAPAQQAAAPSVAPTPAVAATAPVAAPAAVAKPAPAPVQVEETNGRIKASPVARKMAGEKGLSLHQVPGSGDGGRVVKRDIEHYRQFQSPPPRTAAATSEHYTEEGISQMRKTIARRLAESKFTAPHFYLTMDIDMDAAINARAAIMEELGVKVSFNDMVIKACALALRRHPKINSSWRNEVIRYNEHVNIGVAVAVEEGLLVPVVRFADHKRLEEIGSEVKTLAEKAKNKKLQPQEWEGNTFTVSNLGMFGIEEFTAIINPPDACILAVGAIRQVPVVKGGQVVPGQVMKVTLSCDHRVVDGASGAAFLQTLKRILEQPVLLFA